MWCLGQREKWPLLIFFLILWFHCVAILLFTKGFLLTRTELPNHSSCFDVSKSPCFIPPSNFNQTNTHQHCWTRPAVDRLVVIVLDALRFDFVAPSNLFEERKPWMDKLPVLQKLAHRQGLSAKIFKAIADPPTTSLQRLKGLTTGGLPTFIDVGNSFGAPAIVEDNLIYQLANNGKRVVMMGDDTWLQLFPHHFNKSFPFPSFNVKDLDTVDNGCIKHLIPSLYEEDWDVLIAHFLGVDHAGHIFGVDSVPMIEKLEQYNDLLEKVLEVLESQSGPRGLHENTLLLVMGDHGQTINGDHGGGSAEEVETSIIALSLKPAPSSVPLEFDASSCHLSLDGRKTCISSIQQLDFAVTVSALLGVPFSFGSIGRVNPELYALAAGTWSMENSIMDNCQNQSNLEEWMQNYANVLCINSWQVKRYIDVYSASSVIGFSKEDLMHVLDKYAQAEEYWSHISKEFILHENKSCYVSQAALKKQIDAYSDFLASVAELARSKWTEFDLKMMGIGFSIMITSLVFHFLAIKRVDKRFAVCFPSLGTSGSSSGLIFAYIVVVIRACSFLSNSYILEEGKVANFLLATTGILNLRYAIMRKKMRLEAAVFVLLTSILRLTIELGLSKQAVSSAFLNMSPSWMLGIAKGYPVQMYMVEILPMLTLILLSYMLYKSISRDSYHRIWKYVISGTIFCYMLVAVHWAAESNLLTLSLIPESIRRNVIPQIIYAVGFMQLLSLSLFQLFSEEKSLDCEEQIFNKTVAILAAWSSTVIILSGKQGPLVVVASIVGGWCIMRLKSLDQDTKKGNVGIVTLHFSPVTQWSVFAVCLFFSTGHWCAFDGLRYASAFIGFDNFILIPQAILLTIDTFGFSHILPIFGLSFLVPCQYQLGQAKQRKRFVFMQLSRVYLMYGIIMATAVTFTTLCVMIQRRHLMVWGLFAPKFVFDAVGLILSDILICLASLYYLGRVEVSHWDQKVENEF